MRFSPAASSFSQPSRTWKRKRRPRTVDLIRARSYATVPPPYATRHPSPQINDGPDSSAWRPRRRIVWPHGKYTCGPRIAPRVGFTARVRVARFEPTSSLVLLPEKASPATCFIPRGGIPVPVPAISPGLASVLKITWPLLSPPLRGVLGALPYLFSGDRNKMTARWVVGTKCMSRRIIFGKVFRKYKIKKNTNYFPGESTEAHKK